MQSLRLCLLELVLSIPKPGLQLHCTSQIVRVVGGVRLGAFDACVCFVKPAFLEKQVRQFVIIPGQLIMPVERGRDPEGCLEVVDGLLCLSLGIAYLTKDAMTFADHELFAFAQKKIDRS